MSKVVLKLLGPLNINKIQENLGEEIQILCDFLLILSSSFKLKAHVSTNASNCAVMVFQCIVHFAESRFLGSEANIEKNCILWRIDKVLMSSSLGLIWSLA